MSDPACRLYLITPARLQPGDFAKPLAQALDGGDVACVQLRLKEASDDQIRAASDLLMPLCHERGVSFILNDRPDLAAELGCDGVHVGQEDAPYGQARSLVGRDRIVGVTCHDSQDLAVVAAEAGADYVAYGAFFATTTKQAKSQAGLDLLTWWQEVMTVPVVAIGGITVENCPALVGAGADFLAVAAGVWDYPDGPGAAVTAFNRVFAAAA